jgi:hypothetical protein
MAVDVDALELRLAPLLTGEVCFDAMVPRHLCRIKKVEAIVQAFAGRARWPEAVDIEWRRAQTNVPGLKELRRGPFGKTVKITEDQARDADDLRLEKMTRSQVTSTTVNLGEAEAVVLCKERGWPLVTHDELGKQWAAANGISVFDVADVLLAAARLGCVKPGKANKCFSQLFEPTDESDPAKAAMISLPPPPPGDPRAGSDFLECAEALYSRYIAAP